jgi:hypothetical protein
VTGHRRTAEWVLHRRTTVDPGVRSSPAPPSLDALGRRWRDTVTAQRTARARELLDLPVMGPGQNRAPARGSSGAHQRQDAEATENDQ